MMSIRRHTQTTATTYKSFHCTEVFCCLNVHPFILLCTVVFPYYESSLIVFSWWVFRNTWRPQPAYYKSFHCTYVSSCLNVHPFILLYTLVFPYHESSLIVFSWWVFGDTLRQRLLLTSHSTVQNCAVVSMYIRSFFSAPLSSLIINHLWLSSHDEYSEIHEDPNLLITSHSTVHT